MKPRNLAIAVGVAVWTLAGAAAANAMTLTTGNDPVESVATQITANGTTSDYYYVIVTEKAAGGEGCAANAEADSGTQVIDQYTNPGPYSQSTNRTPMRSSLPLG